MDKEFKRGDIGMIGYEILDLEDVSHAGAKRYSAVTLLDPPHPREMMRAVIAEVTEDLKGIDYYRSEMVEQHWIGKPAHVVWLFLAGNLEDIQHENWLAKSLWISPELDKQWWPTKLDGDEEFAGISIKWNPTYKGV